MSEIEIKNPKLFSESWNELPEEIKITCKQSAEAQEERLRINACKRKYSIAENPYSGVSAAIPCYTQGCSNCIYKSDIKHIEWEEQHNLRTVYPKVEWTNRGSLKDTSLNLAADALSLQVKSYTQKIADYVESQIKEFLEDNKISERQWLKRGVIQSLPPEIGCQSYILYYKNWRMEVRRKVTVGYDFIIK